MSDGQMHLAGKREGIRGELRRNVLGQLKDQIYLEDEQLYDQIDAVIRQKGREVYLPLKERLWLRNSLYDSFRRLDILQELLDDKEVTEIMTNGAGKIFIEKKGKMLLWNRRFEKTEQLEDIIQQIVGKVNRIVNVSSPIADARLEDGSRVHIVLPPVALDGPVVTIRKFPEPVTIEKLIRFQAITEEAAAILQVGDTVTITGYILCGRDAVLPKVIKMVKEGKVDGLGISLQGNVIFHTAVSPAGVGPTSSNKLEIESSMEPLSKAGIKLHLGKGAIHKETVEALHKYNAVYAVIPPVTALLADKTIEQKLVAFPELGMEALYQLKVVQYPAIIAAAHGRSIYE